MIFFTNVPAMLITGSVGFCSFHLFVVVFLSFFPFTDIEYSPPKQAIMPNFFCCCFNAGTPAPTSPGEHIPREAWCEIPKS